LLAIIAVVLTKPRVHSLNDVRLAGFRAADVLTCQRVLVGNPKRMMFTEMTDISLYQTGGYETRKPGMEP
jgi:hypothetical protein